MKERETYLNKHCEERISSFKEHKTSVAAWLAQQSGTVSWHGSHFFHRQNHIECEES